ncbi:MAG: reverse transcriptase domain-containing protein, partial [Myxococcota bacterium]|nr:reverse transcriptase domain-containing protein [Myxococcota bacterium]
MRSCWSKRFIGSERTRQWVWMGSPRYLHYALDEWFLRDVVPRMEGLAKLVRYADDFVMVFENEEDARRVMRVLPQRLDRYGLRLSPKKTRLIPFQRPSDCDGKGPSTFDFLGFTWHWGRKYRTWTVCVKTRVGRMVSALAAISEWCRRHRHDSVREQHHGLTRRLRGHFNYFAVTTNGKQVWRLLYWVTRIWKRWLARRSQRSRMSWARFQAIERALPLPRPKLKPLLRMSAS